MYCLLPPKAYIISCRKITFLEKNKHVGLYKLYQFLGLSLTFIYFFFFIPRIFILRSNIESVAAGNNGTVLRIKGPIVFIQVFSHKVSPYSHTR